MDSETFDKLIASPQCRYDHDDPEFLDCFQARCDHIDHFGCRCVECSDENAPIFYHGSEDIYYYAQEETTAPYSESQEYDSAGELPPPERMRDFRDIETNEVLSYYECISRLDARVTRMEERLSPIEKICRNDRNSHKRQNPSPGVNSWNTPNKRPRPQERNRRQNGGNDHERRTIMETRPQERERLSGPRPGNIDPGGRKKR